MRRTENLTWVEGPYKDELILRTQGGEDIAHIFPRQGHGGYTLCTRDHGGWWSDKPGQYYDTLYQAQHQALEHGTQYFIQEQRNLSAMSRQHAIQNLEEQWQQMGGDPKTIKEFRKEWDRVSAAEHHLKVPGRDQGHER